MRNSIWTFLFGITFERQLVWHKILAVITAAMALYHGLLAKFKLNGWLTFGCLAGLLFFSLPPFRRKVYEFFYRTHWILFIGVVAFGLMHGATIGVLGFIGNIIDFILRAIIISRNKKNSFEVIAVRLPADVIRLTFKKGSFDYKAG
jgi:NADPH oxidase